MKTIKFLQYAVVALCAAFTMTACSNDDDDNTSNFKCNPSKVTVEEGATAKALISGGKATYTIKVSDEKIATAKLTKDTIFVTGVKAGATAVVVSDAQKQSMTLPVTVKAKTKK